MLLTIGSGSWKQKVLGARDGRLFLEISLFSLHRRARYYILLYFYLPFFIL